MKSVGTKIRARRKELGMRQKELAYMVDIVPHSLSEIENGRKGISIPLLVKICIVLKISSDYLLDLKKEND